MTKPQKADAKKQVLGLLSDRWWRLNNLYWIQDYEGRETKFVPNSAQVQLWDDIHHLNCILKARQLGFSTFISIFILDTCLFRSNTAAGVIDITLDDVKGKLEKIRFAYARLPEEIRKAIPIKTDNTLEIAFRNGSSVKGGTSHRGGTLQILHVSEFGKISAQYPDKAREIRTGAFGTVHVGQMIFVESTAEGVGGDFYNIVTDAQDRAKQGKEPAKQEFKLHFYAWHEHTGYVDDPERAIITPELKEYFDDLQRNHGIMLTPEQKAWYALKRKIVGPDDMFREYPSYPEEAFKVAVEGAYFKRQMGSAREQGRLGTVTLDTTRPVHTCWDIGVDDATAIWFFQSDGVRHRIVDYYEASGEGMNHYARILKDKATERGFQYGNHYGPHDLDNRDWIMPDAQSRVDVARGLGLNFTVVPRVANKADAIEALRNWLGNCWIDETHCARGIQCLDNYRREWDERLATWRQRPLHDWSSHGADALMTGAMGHMPDAIPEPSDAYRRRRSSTSSAWAV